MIQELQQGEVTEGDQQAGMMGVQIQTQIRTQAHHTNPSLLQGTASAPIRIRLPIHIDTRANLIRIPSKFALLVLKSISIAPLAETEKLANLGRAICQVKGGEMDDKEIHRLTNTNRRSIP
mmetsp:Transcript_23103/g.32301  ORF Transcript_23103/g.32301 Transcript_23103/m.32301 type:complete len:121 (-) Transcript_23103:815-1177(-)